MSITNITVPKPTWTPIKIEMEFTTRDEFCVFLEFLGNPTRMATTIEGGSHIAHLSCSEIEQLIDGMSDPDVYRQLSMLRSK